MSWQEVTVVSQRKEFVGLALAEGANVRELCRRFGISHATGYKWLRRYRHSGESGLLDQSRRPLHSPARTPPEVEQALLEARSAIRVGELVSFDGGFWTAEICLRRTCQPPVPSQPSSSETAALILRKQPNADRTYALNMKDRTCCGRWTSRATSR